MKKSKAEKPPSRIAQASKAIAGALAALLTALELATDDASLADLSLDAWVKIVVATVVAFLAVYNVPNAKP